MLSKLKKVNGEFFVDVFDGTGSGNKITFSLSNAQKLRDSLDNDLNAYRNAMYTIKWQEQFDSNAIDGTCAWCKKDTKVNVTNTAGLFDPVTPDITLCWKCIQNNINL